MPEIDPRLADAIRRLTDRLKDVSPELHELVSVDRILAGSEAEHMAKVMEVVNENPDLAKQIEKIAAEEFDGLRRAALEEPEVQSEVDALKNLPARQEALNDLGMTEEDLVFWPEGTLLPQLHPLVQAAIAERLQFDDDIPELRTGSLPPDAMPAVPVDTTARSPVAIGAQLDQAAKEVRQELTQAQGEKMLQVEALHRQLASPSEKEAWDEPTALAKTDDVKQEITRVTEGRVGVPGYEAGKAPALRKVEPTNLATLSTEDQRKFAFKTLASTQGRKSVVPVIARLLAKDLIERGHEVSHAPWDSLARPLAYAEWTASISGGHQGTNPRFSTVDVAYKALMSQLARKIGPVGMNLVLQVRPVNTVEDRQVGWMAQVVPAQ